MRPRIEKFLPIFAERLENSFFWIRDSTLEKQLYLSPSFDSIWGLSREQVYRDPLAWTWHLNPEDLAVHNAKKMLELHAQEGSSARFQAVYRILHPQKGLRWIKDTSFPLYENGVCIGFAGIAEDITHEKEYEVELQRQKDYAEAANDAKSEFIANMSHDIRTAITGMLGLIYGWKKRAVAQVDQEHSVLLEGCTNELLKLFNEVIEIVSIEAGQLEQESIEFSLSALMQHNITLLMPAAKTKNLTLSLKMSPLLPDYYTGKKILLDRVILNLVSNAIKFTQQGQITVTVSFVEQKGSVVILKIAVTDTGIGIPQDKLEVIFDKFVRLTSAYQGIYKGTGLGLYTVKQFVTLLDGDVHVMSELGKGSQFTITLPLEVTERDRIQTLETIDIDQASSVKNDRSEKDVIRVLVVEDQPLAALAAHNLLQMCGCQVDIAETGQEAMQHVYDYDYDLILMDIGLPDQTGIEVAATIRRLEGSKSTVPIVALSAHLMDENRKGCVRAGMNGMFDKPLTVSMARDILERWVHKDKSI